MSRACTICTHPNKDEIERAVVGRIGSIRAIADKFDISRPSLIRHVKDHLSKTVIESEAGKRIIESNKLGETIQKLVDRSIAIIEETEKDDPRVALLAIKEARETLKLQAEITGELDPTAPTALGFIEIRQGKRDGKE